MVLPRVAPKICEALELVGTIGVGLHGDNDVLHFEPDGSQHYRRRLWNEKLLNPMIAGVSSVNAAMRSGGNSIGEVELCLISAKLAPGGDKLAAAAKLLYPVVVTVRHVQVSFIVNG